MPRSAPVGYGPFILLSEMAARYIGYSLKECEEIEDFTVQEIRNPRAVP